MDFWSSLYYRRILAKDEFLRSTAAGQRMMAAGGHLARGLVE